jgi:hypothetical protein
VCELPRRTWRASLPPRRIVLGLLALGAVVAGVVLDHTARVGALAVGGVLALVAVLLPAIREIEFGLPVGVRVRTAVRSREEDLRTRFDDGRGEAEMCAHLLCDDEAVAARLLEVTWSRTAARWRGATGERLRVYVLCSLVEAVVAHRLVPVAPPRGPVRPAPLDLLSLPERVTVVLHDFAHLSVGQIAEIRGTTEQEVVTALRRGEALVDAPTGP